MHEALLGFSTHFGNGEYFLLCGVEQFLGITAQRIEGIGGDFITRHDQVAQYGPFTNDFGITPDIGRRRRIGRQLTQVGQATRVIGQAGLFNGLGDGDHVGRFAPFQQTAHLLEDQFMFATIEIGFRNQIGNTIQRLVIQQQPTKHGLFGFDGMRRHAQLGNRRINRLVLIGEITLARGA